MHRVERRYLFFSDCSSTKSHKIQVWCREENPQRCHFKNFGSVWAESFQRVKVLNPFPSMWFWRKSPQRFALAKLYTESYIEHWDPLGHGAKILWTAMQVKKRQLVLGSVESAEGSPGRDQRGRVDTSAFPFPGISQEQRLPGIESRNNQTKC